MVGVDYWFFVSNLSDFVWKIPFQQTYVVFLRSVHLSSLYVCKDLFWWCYLQLTLHGPRHSYVNFPPFLLWHSWFCRSTLLRESLIVQFCHSQSLFDSDGTWMLFVALLPLSGADNHLCDLNSRTSMSVNYLVKKNCDS